VGDSIRDARSSFPSLFCFVIVEFVGVSASNSVRVCMDLQCLNTPAEEQVDSFYNRVITAAVLICSILVKNRKTL